MTDTRTFKKLKAARQAALKNGTRWKLTLDEVEAVMGEDGNLSGADLDGANLGGADLSGADLDGANLGGANLGGATLFRANLFRADLGGANLYGANLDGANLYGANLDGAKINWQSHRLIGEILRRAAGRNLLQQAAAGLIRENTDWCWNIWTSDTAPNDIDQTQWYTLVVANRAWALAELAKWVQDDDGAPDVLVEYVKEATS